MSVYFVTCREAGAAKMADICIIQIVLRPTAKRPKRGWKEARRGSKY